MTWPLVWRSTLLYWQAAAEKARAENHLLRTAIRDANSEMHKQKRLLADIIDKEMRAATLRRIDEGGSGHD
jgi:hypothetical protein